MAVFELMEAERRIARLVDENIRLSNLLRIETRRAEDVHGESQRAALEVERLRVALTHISMHELRDHEDYEAIQDIADDALKQRESGQ